MALAALALRSAGEGCCSGGGGLGLFTAKQFFAGVFDETEQTHSYLLYLIEKPTPTVAPKSQRCCQSAAQNPLASAVQRTNCC